MYYTSSTIPTLDPKYIKLRFVAVLIGLLLGTNLAAQITEESSPNNQVLVKRDTPVSIDSITLKGVVETQAGDSLIGAAVFVEVRQVGAITDFDGNFSLKVSPLEVIKVTYSGLKSAEIPVRQLVSDNESGQLRITLDEKPIIVREQLASCAVLANPICSCHSPFNRLVHIRIKTDSELQGVSKFVEVVHQSNLQKIQLFPNPVDDIIGVKFNPPAPTIVTARLFDFEGELLRVWAPRELKIGQQEERFGIRYLDMAPGHYYLTLTDQTGVVETRVVIKGR